MVVTTFTVFHMLINYQRHFWVKMSDKYKNKKQNKKYATIHENAITTIHVVIKL